MKRNTYTLLILYIVLAMSGCNNHSEFRQQLESLDSLLIDNPDSVYNILVGIENDANKHTLSDKMYYELLRADAQNKAYIDFTTDSVMLNVANYYDHHGTPNEQMRAHYLLGCTYRDLNDVPMELQCFQEAVEKADTTAKDCDLYTLYAIYGQMADIYNSQYLPKEELKALDNCEKVAILDGDTISATSAYALKIRVYSVVNKPDSVLITSNQARECFLRQGEIGKAARVLSASINILINQHKLDQAKELMEIYEKESDIYMSIENYSEQGIMHLYDRGRYYLFTNNTDSAKLFFYKLLSENLKEPAYKGLLMTYQQLHQPDSMAKYALLYAQANDSSYISMNSEYIERMTASYNYAHQKSIAQKELLEKEKEKEKNLILTIMLIYTLLVISVATFFALNHYKRVKLEHTRKEAILYRSYNNTIEKIRTLERERDKYALLRDTNEENIIKLQQLKKEIDEYKQDKEDLIKKLEHLGTPPKEIDYKVWLENFQHDQAFTILWERLIKVKSYDNKPISRQVWNDVYNLFMRECPRFIGFVESPEKDLNDLDKKVVMLSISGFKTSDIAVLLGKSKQQISNIHSRIKTKLYPELENTHHLKKALLTTLRKSLE